MNAPTGATVSLWEAPIGTTYWDASRESAVFTYNPEFVASGIQVSPRQMLLGEEDRQFNLPDEFMGLPGLLADSLPGFFGNQIINAWAARNQVSLSTFTPVDRLCYIGTRGMGALEYQPALVPEASSSVTRSLDIEALVKLSADILSHRNDLKGFLDGRDDEQALANILKVGSSAGGARAKALLAWNPSTGEFRSGQLEAGDGFEHWLLKFDGANKATLGDPEGFSLIEFAYYKMALQAGINMMPCRLHPEGGRSHFMTKRFDRRDNGEKVHMQSAWAMEHAPYKMGPVNAYESQVDTVIGLGMGMDTVEEIYRRALFNIMARNQDDHVKNTSYLMDREGKWSLAPAYDITYGYEPSASHHMNIHKQSINGKFDNFIPDDFTVFAETSGIRPMRASEIAGQVRDAVATWMDIATEIGIEEEKAQGISVMMRQGLVTASHQK